MDIQTMHNRIRLRTQKINSNAFDDILSEEIDAYINDEIQTFIKDRFEPRSNQFGLGFEQSIKRIEDLQTLIETDELDTTEQTQSIFSNIFIDQANIPNDYFLPLSVSIRVFYDTTGIQFSLSSGKRVPDQANDTYGELITNAEFKQHDDILASFKDPFNRPRIQEGKFTIDNDKIYSYTDNTFITDAIILTYIRQPVEVSLSGGVDCDLSPNVHSEIVNMASETILSDIEALGKQAQVKNLNDFE